MGSIHVRLFSDFIEIFAWPEEEIDEAELINLVRDVLLSLWADNILRLYFVILGIPLRTSQRGQNVYDIRLPHPLVGLLSPPFPHPNVNFKRNEKYLSGQDKLCQSTPVNPVKFSNHLYRT